MAVTRWLHLLRVEAQREVSRLRRQEVCELRGHQRLRSAEDGERGEAHAGAHPPHVRLELHLEAWGEAAGSATSVLQLHGRTAASHEP